MKKRPPLTIKQLLLAIVFFLLFIALTLFLFTFKKEEAKFHNAVTHLFIQDMTSNTLNMHYTIANPKDFGIYEYQAILPCYQKDTLTKSQKELEESLTYFSSINQKKLSPQDKDTLSLLIRYLTNSVALSKYPYFEEPLSPSSGMQSQLPILLADYTFRCKQDVLDYLSILSQSGNYLTSLLIFEQEKAQAGFLLPAATLKKVGTQCYTMLMEEELSRNSHFLQTTFEDRVTALVEEGVLTPREKEDFIRKNNHLLATVLRPAYETLGNELYALADDSIPLRGLASKEGGKEYYRLLLIQETGSYRPIEEIHTMLLKQLHTEWESYSSILAKSPSFFDDTIVTNLEATFPYHNASQMLNDLQTRMANDFPSLLMHEAKPPTATVKSVSESLAPYCSPAYYLTVPLDDTTSNVIYINQSSTTGNLELYTTLAHEGYPGHLYETVYHNRLHNQMPNGIAMKLQWYGGYLEGWALYSEFLAYDYAALLLEENKQTQATLYVNAKKHNRSLQICLLSLLDLLIHYHNASFEDVADFLNSIGITDSESVLSIYEYIVEEPANYLKYYLGYLEILSLKKEAKTLWASAYQDYHFHQFLLDNGPADFETLHYKLSHTTSPVSP